MKHATLLLVVSLATLYPMSAEADLIGVSFGNALDGYSGGPTNWNSVTSTTSPINNLIDESGATTGLSLSFSGLSSFYGGTLDSSSVPIHSPSLAKLNGNIYGFDGPFTAIISGLNPNQAYDVYFFGVAFGNGMNQTVTITGASSSTFTQQRPISSALMINGQVGNSNTKLRDYALPIDPTASGSITFKATIPNSDNILGVAGLAVETVSAVPEPSTALPTGLIGLGAVAYTWWRKKAWAV